MNKHLFDQLDSKEKQALSSMDLDALKNAVQKMDLIINTGVLNDIETSGFKKARVKFINEIEKRTIA